MRYGVISDVHANLHALDAVLDRLAGEGVDAYLCAGDLVGYGPFPDECVRRVLDLPGIVCVAGNHDLIVLGELSDQRCVALARDSLRWTRGAIDSETWDRLGALPRSAVVDGVAVFHGSIGDPQAYVHTEMQALECLRALPSAAPAAELMVVGHTHRSMAVGERRGALRPGTRGEVALPAGERVLLNPGAVGQSRERAVRAHAMVLDLDARTARFCAVPYDVAACRAALRERGLPPEACHMPPSPWGELTGRAKRGVRRVQSRLAAGAGR
jgi:predicted phosphodiesterase